MLLHVHLDGTPRTVSLGEFEELVRTGTIGPETPVRAGDGWAAARELPAWREVWDSPAARVSRALARPDVPWMTALLVGLLWRAHAWLLGEPRALAEALFVKLAAAVTEHGEGWRVLTYALLHADFEHAASNLLFLALTGVVLEAVYGPWAVLGLFLVSVVAGGTLSTLGSDTAGLGASGADFGFLAAAAVAGWRYGDLVPRRLRPFVGGIMAVYLANALWNGLQGERVDNLAHLGGALGGGALALGLRPHAVEAWRRRNLVLLAAGALASAACVAGLLLRPLPLSSVAEDGLTSVRPEAWTPGYAPVGELAWASPLGDAWVGVKTTDKGAPAYLEVERAQRLRALEALPAAKVASTTDATRGGVPGVRIEATYTRNDTPRRVVLATWVRGEFVHEALVDLPADDTRRAPLYARVVDDAVLAGLAEAGTADGAPDTARGDVARAKVAARTVGPAAALPLLARARERAPTDDVPILAGLALARSWNLPERVTWADDALQRFGGSRAVVAAALHALSDAAADASTPQEAAVLNDRVAKTLISQWNEHPGDRTLARTARELDVALPEPGR